MFRNRWTYGLVAVVAATLLGASSLIAQDVKTTQEPKTVTEKIKSGASSAVDSIKKGAASAEEAISNQFHKAKSAISSMGIEARVYSRIHWDKNLTGSKIDLGAPKEGTISLTGTVPDAKAKAKAVEITTDTIGVVNVVDNLTIDTTTIVEPTAK